MLSPHIKRKVDKLWDSFWTAGLTNPLVAIEQITYLLFLKRLESLDRERVKKGKPSIYEDGNGEKCRWSYIKGEPNPIHLRDVVFPWLRNLEKKFAGSDKPANGIEAVGNRMKDAYFQLDPNKGAILQEAVRLIDALFDRADTAGAAADIMGDTFEYLLSEISSAGKNGQFRTPRHIIRLMVELLDPQPGERVIDPAAGTGGFLFSTLRHILMRHTDPARLRIEWDGTPHRTCGDWLSPKEYEHIHSGDHYAGFENDRTMVRIGWMNLILHGIENPQIRQRDSLGKRRDDSLKSESYDYVLANPPFTGKVDSADLERSIFPPAGKTGKKAARVITNKSELLFVWLMLDLLQVEGRCAVIVPEGILFGGTGAHLRLRRELLTEHLMEAVISLPGGVFQPYTGVKTSILVFQKETPKADRDKWKPADPPRTRTVWFYEVKEEAFSLDAKRAARNGQNNDLWDVAEKFKKRHDPEADELAYYQPTYHAERWRVVDKRVTEIFADEPNIPDWKDKAASVHELFPDLPDDPDEAHQQTEKEEGLALRKLAMACLNSDARAAFTQAKQIGKKKARSEEVEKLMKEALVIFRRLCNQQKQLFDQEDQLAWKLFQSAFQSALEEVSEDYTRKVAERKRFKRIDYDPDAAAEEARRIAKAFARLDGYDVMLRSIESYETEERLSEARSWTVAVRVYARDDAWESEDGKLKGSHDEKGDVRPEYAASIKLYDDKGKLIDGLLDPDCIEARGWNLSASQYKPFTFASIKEYAPKARSWQYQHERRCLKNQLSELHGDILTSMQEWKGTFIPSQDMDEFREQFPIGDLENPDDQILRALNQLAGIGLIAKINIPSINGDYVTAFRGFFEEEFSKESDIEALKGET